MLDLSSANSHKNERRFLVSLEPALGILKVTYTTRYTTFSTLQEKILTIYFRSNHMEMERTARTHAAAARRPILRITISPVAPTVSPSLYYICIL